jgi:NADPH2:quinone reductase
MSHTTESGVDCVFDPVGGDIFYNCVRCIRTGGCLLSIGYASGVVPVISMEHLLNRNISIVGVWTYAVHYPSESQHSVLEVVRLW